jgi:hypothetical protein
MVVEEDSWEVIFRSMLGMGAVTSPLGWKTRRLVVSFAVWLLEKSKLDSE